MNTTNTPVSAVELPAAPMTPGRMLRAAREARGLHLGMLAVTLKVPTRQLEALENDQYDAFRGPVFVRAMAQSMCRQLGIDPVPVLAGLPRNASSVSVEHSSLGAPSRAAMRPVRVSRGPLVSRQVLVLALLMLGGVAALVWWPASAPTPSVVAVVADEPQTPAAEASAAQEPVSVNVPSVPEGPTSSASASVPPSLPAVAPAAVPVALPQSDPKSDMQIAASADTWLEVRDARGQLVVNRLLKAGETQPVALPAPFSVVVGRAHAVKVTLGGKDFDLAPHTKASTARFDIQP